MFDIKYVIKIIYDIKIKPRLHIICKTYYLDIRFGKIILAAQCTLPIGELLVTFNWISLTISQYATTMA